MKLTKNALLSAVVIFAGSSLVSLGVTSCGGDEPNDSGKEIPTPDPDPTPSPIVDDELRIMSFNMRHEQSSDTGEKAWASRRDACVAMVKDQLPDVMGCQELHADERSYVDANLPDYGMVYVLNGGNQVVYYRKDRFTKVDSGYFFLSFTPDTPSRTFNVGDTSMRNGVWVKLKDNKTGKEFVAMDTHFPTRGGNTNFEAEPYNEARILSAELCMERLRLLAGNNTMCFFFGDLNCSWLDSSGSEAKHGSQVKAVLDKWMTDAREKAKNLTPNGVTSYNNFGSGSMTPNRDIDHIYFRNAETIDFNTITKAYNGIRYISDHYPIMLRVKL